MSSLLKIDVIEEPVSTTMLQYGVPLIAGSSVLVNTYILLCHHRSLWLALRTLWQVYRILDSKPPVLKAFALLGLLSFWHQPPLALILPAIKLVSYALIVIMDLQICFFAFLVEGAFCVLYRRIKDHYRLLIQTSDSTGPVLYFKEPFLKLGQPVALDLYVLRYSHRQLYKVLSVVTGAYDLAALVITASCRFLFTVYLHRWISSHFITAQLVYALLTLQRIFCICFRFQNLKRVEKMTADMINGLDKSPLDAKTRAELKLFFVQLKSHRMNFNTIQMFDLDFSLISAMITTTITYLMLLRQFTS